MIDELVESKTDKLKALLVCEEIQEYQQKVEFVHRRLYEENDWRDPEPLRVERPKECKKYVRYGDEGGSHYSDGGSLGSSERSDKSVSWAEDTVQKKALYSAWDKLQCQSKVQFHKLKKRKKEYAYLTNYHRNKAIRKQLAFMEVPSATLQDSIAVKLLTDRLLKALRFRSYKDEVAPKLVQVYEGIKLTNLYNYGISVWKQGI